MPSGTDFYNELKGANHRLDQISSKLDTLITTVSDNFSQLLTLTTYTNQALYQNAQQNDTIICILEKISKQTCELLNQACLQTALQTAIGKNAATLAELFAATHADAALTREREQALRDQIERCCPPPTPRPCCHYEPCPAPKPLGPPKGGPVIE
jgi:hypothetical protein